MEQVCVGGRKSIKVQVKHLWRFSWRQDDGFSCSFTKYIMAVRTALKY